MSKQISLPDPKRLAPEQLRGESCAWCGNRLRQARHLGQVVRTYAGGHRAPYELWVCDPECSSA